MEEETNKEAKTVGWKRRILRWLLMAAVLFVVAIAAFVLSIPYLLTHVPIPELEFDLSPHVKGRLAEIARSKTATVDLDIKRGKPDGFRVRAKGMLLDWPYTATANVRFGFVRADGDLTLSIDGTDWRLYADFSAQGTKVWRFNANVAERAYRTSSSAEHSPWTRRDRPRKSAPCQPGPRAPRSRAWTRRSRLRPSDSSRRRTCA